MQRTYVHSELAMFCIPGNPRSISPKWQIMIEPPPSNGLCVSSIPFSRNIILDPLLEGNPMHDASNLGLGSTKYISRELAANSTPN
jgi:hypothetical protein